MSTVRPLFLLVAILLMPATMHAQSTLPFLRVYFPALSLPSGTAADVDLRVHFTLPGVTGQLVQFDTILGKFNVELLAGSAPQNAANFLNYVQAGAYTSSIFHRSAALDTSGLTSIVQGGGYTLSGTNLSTIATFNPVPLEYNLPNARGTLAAARTSDINSATSQWYINTRDNSTILGQANGGGYTVFGRVLGSGMTVVDAFASLPRTSIGSPLTELPVRNYSGGAVQAANLAVINSVSLISLYPGSGTSLLTFSGGNSAPSTVNATLSGSTLTLTPLAGGSAAITLRATDTNGNYAEDTFLVTVPVTAAPGGSGTFVAPDGASSHQWQHNGTDLAGATAATLTVNNVQPASAGLYASKMTFSGSTGTTTSRSAILGVSASTKVVGTGSEVGANILHPNGNTFDQILLEGAAASFTADPGQITRLSYIDLNDDIVQVEFSGPGAVSIVLDNQSGPATPTKYHQPTVNYVKGNAGIVITGANETSHLTIFTVGRATAFDPTFDPQNPAAGGYNILEPPSATNVPANNRSSLFTGHELTVYDGVADVAFVAIASTDGKFGGLRGANANFLATRGLTGVFAPDVEFTGPVFVGDIAASDDASPVLMIGSGSDVRITGGDLLQPNGRAVQVGGISELKFAAGSTSHGTIFAAQNNQGKLEQNGADVTSQIVVNP